MIQISGLHKSYGRNTVLKGIDLQIKERKVTAVIGPNASGKTTLIKCILGLVIPQCGSVTFNGEDIMNKWAYRSEIGYLSQIAKFPENLKVKELISMIRDIRRQPGDESVLMKTFDLQRILNQPLNTLSGGTRQKLNIMLSFMFDCQFYILDEPTTGLDPAALISFRELLCTEREKGKTILLTTHILSLIEEVADEIIFLLEGKIFFSGSLTDLKNLQGEQTLEHTLAKIYQANYV